MSFRRQVAYVVLGFVVLLFVTPLVWSLASNAITGRFEVDDRGGVLAVLLAFLWLVGGVIYLAVSAALRHTRDRG